MQLGRADAVVVVCMVIAGFAYFSQYYDHGFLYTDEGSLLLITSKLLSGERPYLDIKIGYGVLWYYPLALVFLITGVDFVVARIFLLLVALVTSLLAFLTLRRQGSRIVLAGAISAAILLVPGTLHKDYIPLMVVANMLCLSSLRLDRPDLARTRVFVAGLVATMSFHTRPDIGLIALATLVGALLAHSIRLPRKSPLAVDLATLYSIVFAAFLIPTLPLAVIAHTGAYLGPFVLNLLTPLRHMSWFLGWTRGTSPTDVATGLQAKVGMNLPRVPIETVLEGSAGWELALLTYLPLVGLMLIISLMVPKALGWIRGRSSSNELVPLLALTCLAFSAFPQFFFFRPDGAHLSQFMPGYLVLFGSLMSRVNSPSPLGLRKRSMISVVGLAARNPIRIALMFFCCVHILFYTWFGLNRGWTGSIALSRNRTERFVGEGGVDVFVTPAEQKIFSTVVRVVEKFSDTNDPLLCFPYMPGFNVITGRRTFARDLYVDDKMLVRDPEWQERMVRQIQSEEPPVIVVSDWAVHGTEISRFRNWATRIMDHIEREYVVVERYGNLNFYARAQNSY
jgi:hypothetical protein